MAKKIISAPPSHADGVTLGAATTEKAGFHGAAVVQRAGAAQAAVGVAAGANPTKAEFDAAVALINELRAALVEKGIIKGAA